MPPPPAVLFKITGKPMRSACSFASLELARRPVPGKSDTPSSVAIERAPCFVPKPRI